MGKTGMMVLVMAAVVGCATTFVGTAAAEEKPMAKMFGGGTGHVVDFARHAADLERAWAAGTLAVAEAHGALVREQRSEGVDARGKTVRVTQYFADGTTVYRELTMAPCGDILRIRLYDTHADGSRSGFRVDGNLHPWQLPAAIAAARTQLFADWPGQTKTALNARVGR